MDLYYIITDDCNLNCDFCIRNNLGAKDKLFVNPDNFEISTSKLIQIFPRSTLILTGGEPFMHPYFEDILSISMHRFPYVVINSNGVLGYKFIGLLKEALKKNVYLQLSIDGPKSIHDNLRGKGSFSMCINTLDELSDCYDHISISTTVQKGTIEYIKELATDLNHRRFHHHKVSPEQVCEPSQRNIIYADEWNLFVDSFLPVCKYRVHIKKIFFFPLWKKFIDAKEEHKNMLLKSQCGIGKYKLYITTACELLPCTCFNNPLGNVLTDDAHHLFEQINQFTQMLKVMSPICRECYYLRLCQGGCPGYSMRFWGSPNMGDPRCPIIQKSYEEHKGFTY